jgi:hypothetical protein
MDKTIDMAREAGMKFSAAQFSGVLEAEIDEFSLKVFEALVRADQDEKYKWDIHSCGPTCKRYACVAMREAVEAEREACAKVCDEQVERSLAAVEKTKRTTDHRIYRAAAQTATWNAAAIRARGNT